MANGIAELVETFNKVFGDDATIDAADESLRITIRGRTMEIQWPKVIGVASRDLSMASSDTHTPTQ